MQFITLDQRIAVENFEVGVVYTITFTNGDNFTGSCIGIGVDFVAFQRTAPEYIFCLTMAAAADVASIEPLGNDIGKILTYTGSVPVSIKTDGSPLLDYLITGNTVQNGTPTPDNPIMPEGCGERTGNLLNLNRTYSNSFTTDTTKWMNGAATVNNAGTAYAETEIIGDTIKVTSKIPGYGASFLIKASPNTTYTVSFETDKVSSGSWGGISDRDINGTVINNSAIQGKSVTFTTHNNCAFLNVCFRFPPADGTVTYSKIMLNLGSTALQYEPFGVKIPISSAGQTNNIYFGEVETTRKIKKLVLTGNENWTFVSTSNIYIGNTGAKYSSTDEGIICSHFKPMYAGHTDGTCRFANYERITFHYESVLNVDEWKSYLAQQYAAGTPVTVWYVLATEETAVVNEPLMRIGDYADTISYRQSGVNVPTTDGLNIFDIDTTVKPSEVYLKYFSPLF